LKDNGPVSQQEYVLDEHDTLLSTTDLKGRIIYANEAFVQASGFDREELYGKAHNIVRHPDMPPAAFADLWDTLQQGSTWTGLVKNRRKNGDHYWVRANVTPVRSQGSVVGYLSVRTKPTADEVRRHEVVYRRLQQGDTSIHISRGHAVATGWRRLATRLLNISVAGRLRVALSVVSIGSAAALLINNGPSNAAMAWTWACIPLLLGSAMMAWLYRTLVAPLHQLGGQVNVIASGQRARTLFRHRRDEISGLMRGIEQAGLNLIALVGDIQQKANQVNQDSSRMQQGNEDLSRRAEDAAASLQQTAAAMEQLAATVQHNAGTSEQATRLAVDAEAVAQSGVALVRQVQTTMKGIAEASQRVADITGLIDSIAFQTNILALNAAVEAARAGEHGRGFAVVASEVRALANKSATAAQEIRGLIDASQQRVLNGDAVAREAGDIMSSVQESVNRLVGFMQEIQGATREQAEGVAQINTAVSRLDELTQHNASLAVQSFAVSQSLGQQARELDDAAAVFKVS